MFLQRFHDEKKCHSHTMKEENARASRARVRWQGSEEKRLPQRRPGPKGFPRGRGLHFLFGDLGSRCIIHQAFELDAGTALASAVFPAPREKVTSTYVSSARKIETMSLGEGGSVSSRSTAFAGFAPRGAGKDDQAME